MKHELTEAEIIEALEDCASEPVHIPGSVQPIAILLGSDIATGKVLHASANATDIFNGDVNDLLGKNLRDLLGSDIWHSIQNFLGLSDFAERRLFAGLWSKDNKQFAIHVSKGNDFLIVEIESEAEMPTSSPEMLREQNFLIHQIQACQDEDSLFDLSCRLLRHITGFDRVMIYQFDSEWNGEVRAEACKKSMDTFMGLRFPHWDIPEQARAIMARIQLRLICDVNQEPVPIVAQSAKLPPLDISLAQCRAASPVHMQYLKNMGTAATMTLSVVLEGQLWGMISFHHARPKCSSPKIRQILTTGLLPIFCLKLSLLRYQASEKLSRQLDSLQSDIQARLELDTDISGLLDSVGPTICKTLEVDGLVIATGSQNYSFGNSPSQALLDLLIMEARNQENGLLTIESLHEAFPKYRDQCEELAGVLAISMSENRCLLLFRRETKRDIAWAGNPDKTIETVDGNKRLEPRGSFSRFLDATEGRCKAWSEQDKHLARQLWPLLSAAERQTFMSNLSRQQTLMINELNHRVRNILALVKSVSQGARKDTGSLESYCQAIESRIMALAAAHDIGVGAAQSAVSVQRIIDLEAKPYDTGNRFSVTGRDVNVKADLAPILALVIHELTTNAVKHGALSNSQGSVAIDLQTQTDGTLLSWVESNGPPVKAPNAPGFGTTLIQQAIPYELNGTSHMEFASDGLKVTLNLPRTALENSPITETSLDDYIKTDAPEIAAQLKTGMVMILENNFMIANDLVRVLENVGFFSTETFASSEDALEFLETQTPSLALLDLNLGQGQTSHEVATTLTAVGVPFAFITGYGDQIQMPPHLAGIKMLTKPVSKDSVQQCVFELLGSVS